MILSAPSLRRTRIMAQKIPLSPATVDRLTAGSLSDLFTPGLTVDMLDSGRGDGAIGAKLLFLDQRAGSEVSRKASVAIGR